MSSGLSLISTVGYVFLLDFIVYMENAGFVNKIFMASHTKNKREKPTALNEFKRIAPRHRHDSVNVTIPD